MTDLQTAKEIIRESIIHMPRTLMRRAELFLNRKRGRPREINRVKLAQMLADGWTKQGAADELGCHVSAVRLIVAEWAKTKEGTINVVPITKSK